MLGDRKPTQLLRRMEQLLGDRAGAMDSTFLRKLLLPRLPSNVRMVLASANATATLEELAELADKVVEVAAPTVAATSATPFPEILTEIEQLRTEVQKLQTSVRQLTRQSRGRSHSRSRPAPQEQTTCWYHQKYGSNAKKCTPPCNYTQPSNDQASR